MTDEIRADVPAKTIRCRGVVRSVTRPAYVSAGPHSSEILDDGECSRCRRPYRVIRVRGDARLVDCGCNRRWQIDEADEAHEARIDLRIEQAAEAIRGPGSKIGPGGSKIDPGGTPIGIDDSAQGAVPPPPPAPGCRFRAGVQDDPTSSTRGAQDNTGGRRPG